jgi:hypothetical protein
MNVRRFARIGLLVLAAGTALLATTDSGQAQQQPGRRIPALVGGASGAGGYMSGGGVVPEIPNRKCRPAPFCTTPATNRCSVISIRIRLGGIVFQRTVCIQW